MGKVSEKKVFRKWNKKLFFSITFDQFKSENEMFKIEVCKRKKRRSKRVKFWNENEKKTQNESKKLKKKLQLKMKENIETLLGGKKKSFAYFIQNFIPWLHFCGQFYSHFPWRNIISLSKVKRKAFWSTLFSAFSAIKLFNLTLIFTLHSH